MQCLRDAAAPSEDGIIAPLLKACYFGGLACGLGADGLEASPGGAPL